MASTPSGFGSTRSPSSGSCRRTGGRRYQAFSIERPSSRFFERRYDVRLAHVLRSRIPGFEGSTRSSVARSHPPRRRRRRRRLDLRVSPDSGCQPWVDVFWSVRSGTFSASWRAHAGNRFPEGRNRGRRASPCARRHALPRLRDRPLGRNQSFCGKVVGKSFPKSGGFQRMSAEPRSTVGGSAIPARERGYA